MSKTTTITDLQQRIVELERKRSLATGRSAAMYASKIKIAHKQLDAAVAAAPVDDVDLYVGGDAKGRPRVLRRAPASPSVWQGRVDHAIDTLTDDEQATVSVYTCPTPKTATGTATKLRTLIEAGRVSIPGDTRVKSSGADVVLVRS